MVLCKHFQQGCCRFGSKCNFEHIDIKQLVKNDIEGAINGKQYPFSCYGPFKDKPCIPNFIEDQSFEEVRLLCLEARQKNCFDQFHQQFSMGAADAMNKMKAFLQPSYEIMNILTMIYDAPTVTDNSTSSTNSISGTSQLFGANAQADGGASSIFGKSSIAASSVGNNVFSGGIFGGGANANNNTMPAGGIFGVQNNLNTHQQNSIFGQQPQQGNANSIFGGVAKPPLFNQQQTTAANGVVGSGFFGQTAQQTAPSFNHPSHFGQQQPPLQQQIIQPQQASGIFGQSAFGHQQMQQNIGTFASSQQQTQPQSLFSQTAPMQQPIGQQSIAMCTNIFAQEMQQSNAGAPPQGFFQQNGHQPMGIQQQMQQLQQQTISQQAQDFTRNQVPQPTSQNKTSDSVYSKLEDLTAAEIEAFKADSFEPGKIPFCPPPIELLN